MKTAQLWTILLALQFGANANAALITFDELSGSHSDPLLPYAEAGFLVTPKTGEWLQGLDSHVLGNPLPDIYSGAYEASLEVTESTVGLFSFTSIDISSGTLDAPVEYTLVGLLAGATVFSTTGQVPYPFVTIYSPSSAMIDTLSLSIVRLTAESYEVDNIRLNETVALVPEPSSAILLAGLLGICTVGRSFRRRRR